jgi:dihydrofolate synthase/folylpolyglutamate synthase
VFGASADKDIEGMLHVFLAPKEETGYQPADKVIVSKSGHPRSADTAQLADLVRSLNPTCPISVQDNLDSALTEALVWAGTDDLICVTGSIFVVAQARLAWANRYPASFANDDWVFEDETSGTEVKD